MIEQDKYSTLSHDERVSAIAEHMREIIKLIGEDPTREGLIKTPMRAAKAMLDNTKGYSQNCSDTIKSAIFSHDGSDVVIVKDIEFYSLCEHHMLPFYGKVSIGYIPDGSIVGLSKLARVVDALSRRLQVQERLTKQICDEIYQNLPTKGVIVKCNAAHLCMKMRGVEKQESTTTTLQYCGEFENTNLRREFLDLLK